VTDSLLQRLPRAVRALDEMIVLVVLATLEFFLTTDHQHVVRDVDFEINDVDGYINASKAMKNAVNGAGGGRWLSTAAWSTGADCTAATSADPACAGKLSFWGDKAGGERLLALRAPSVAASFNMVNIMSYDARYEHYDGVSSYQQYRELFPSSTIVSIGLETPPEGWSGGILVINDGDAQCEGSKNLQNSYGVNINQAYSVNRYVNAVIGSTSSKRNPRDGAMLWSILKTANGSCGGAAVASPGSIGAKLSTMLGVTNDPLLQQAPWK